MNNESTVKTEHKVNASKILVLEWLKTTPTSIQLAIVTITTISDNFIGVVLGQWQKLTRALWLETASFFQLSFEKNEGILDLLSLALLIYLSTFILRKSNGYNRNDSLLLTIYATSSWFKKNIIVLKLSLLIPTFISLFSFNTIFSAMDENYLLTLRYILWMYAFSFIYLFVGLHYLYNRAALRSRAINKIMREGQNSVSYVFSFPGFLFYALSIVGFLVYPMVVAFPEIGNYLSVENNVLRFKKFSMLTLLFFFILYFSNLKFNIPKTTNLIEYSFYIYDFIFFFLFIAISLNGHLAFSTEKTDEFQIHISLFLSSFLVMTAFVYMLKYSSKVPYLIVFSAIFYISIYRIADLFSNFISNS